MSRGESTRPALIINADDLGIHPDIDAGILSAYRSGILTSATMLTTTAYLERTVADYVRPCALPLGLHLSLTLGKAVAPRGAVPDLIDPEGNLCLSAAQLITMSPRSETGRRILPQIHTEFEAQLGRASDCGLLATHADSHQHVHMNPAIFTLMEELLPRFGIRRIRFSREPFAASALWRDLPAITARRNLPKWLLLRWCAARIKPRLESNDDFFGVLYSGVINRRVMRDLLTRLQPGRVMEVGIHPGFRAPADVQDYPRPGYNRFISSPERDAERDLLSTTEIIALAQARNIRLQSFDGREKG